MNQLAIDLDSSSPINLNNQNLTNQEQNEISINQPSTPKNDLKIKNNEKGQQQLVKLGSQGNQSRLSQKFNPQLNIVQTISFSDDYISSDDDLNQQNKNKQNPVNFKKNIQPKPLNLIQQPQEVIQNQQDVHEQSQNDDIYNNEDKSKLQGQLQKNQTELDIKKILKQEVQNRADEWIINIKDINIEHQIGSGNSCTVYKGKWRGLKVAVKKMKLQDLKKNNFKEFQREISTFIKIKPHNNLVSLMGVGQQNEDFYIITEYCGGGTLFDLLHRQQNNFISWQARIKISKDIADGMQYLHSITPPIIHRDLKSLNLLLEQPFKYQADDVNVKIADFGLSRVNDTEMMTGVLGTFHWMAPEIFESKPYSIKADVYSFGIVLWEICSRETPYKNLQGPHAIMKYVTIDQGRPDLSKIPSDCPSIFIELMKVCWDQDPSKRPNFENILEIFNKLII